MTDQSPPGPPVELGFVDDLPGLRCSPRRRGKLPKICWQVGGEELAIDEHCVARERPTPQLVGNRLECLVDAGLLEGMGGRRGLT